MQPLKTRGVAPHREYQKSAQPPFFPPMKMGSVNAGVSRVSIQRPEKAVHKDSLIPRLSAHNLRGADPSRSEHNGVKVEDTVVKHYIPDEEVAILVMGDTGSGKTSFINLISSATFLVGNDLHSCTDVVQRTEPFMLGPRKVVLIDTPGFGDTTRSDTEILTVIATFLENMYRDGKRLAGVIYIRRISDVRMGGAATRNFRMFRQLCGDEAMKNVILVTNMWGGVSREVGEMREVQLSEEDIFFKLALEKGAKIRRHDNSHVTAYNILQEIAANFPVPLKIQQELVEEWKKIPDTAAGQELNREQAEAIKKLQLEVEELQKELEDAIRMEDDEGKKELEAAKEKLQIKVGHMQSDSDKLAAIRSEQGTRPKDNEQKGEWMGAVYPYSTNRAIAPVTLGQGFECAPEKSRKRDILLKIARKFGRGEDDAQSRPR